MANSPLSKLLSELRFIYPRIAEPDVVISLGTGYISKSHELRPDTRWNFFKDGFMIRLFRAFMAASPINAQNSWIEHWTRLDEQTQQNYIRFNMPLEGKEAQIDDAYRMQELQAHARLHFSLHDSKDLAKRAILAAGFFFELDQEPIEHGLHLYQCFGSLRCRSVNSNSFINEILREYPQAQFRLQEDRFLASLSKDDICKCNLYRKEIVFYVRHKSDAIAPFLEFNPSYRRMISGFSKPKTISVIMKEQGLDAPFGSPDHQEQRYSRRRCGCSPRTRRIDLRAKRGVPLDFGSSSSPSKKHHL